MRRVNDLRLALRAFRWRRGGSLVVLLVGALTVAAAAIGPLYSAAAAESVLQDRLAQATADQTTIAFRIPSDVSYPGSIDVVSSQEAQRGSIPGYGPLVNETVVTTTVHSSNGLEASSDAVWRDGVCQHLVIVAGRCLQGPGDVLVSARSAALMGWKVGSVLTFGQLLRYDTSVTGSAIATTPVHLTVSGTYRPVSSVDSFWAGRVYFTVHPAGGAGDGPMTVDAVFLERDVFPTLQHPTMGSIGADLLLTDPSAIRVADVPRVRAAVEAYLGPDTGGPAPTTGMLALLDRFETERSQTVLAAAVVSAQLALLALLLLYLVVTDTSEARGGEVALAKLRGLRPAAVFAVALREPVVLLVLGVPIGLGLAYLSAQALAGALFFPGVPVVVDRATLVAVGVAFLGGLGAAVAASRRMFTRPVLDQWSSSAEPTPRTRAAVVLEIVLVVAALAGFVALDRAAGLAPDDTSATAALGWLAPGLLVIAIGVVLVRLCSPILGSLVRATRRSRHIGLFLALRQVVRRPSGLRLAALLAVTLGLATFAVDAQAAAQQGRVVRAGADVGAVTSLGVDTLTGPDLQKAVAQADPDGRWAMAVADWIPDGGSLAGRMLAVDSTRLAAVGTWSPDYGAGTASSVAAAISPPVPAPLVLTGGAVRVRVTSGPVAAPAPTVLIGVRDPRGVPVTALAGPLREGTHDYVAPLPPPCPQGGCVFYGVAVSRSLAPAPAHLDLLVTGVAQRTSSTWAPIPAPLTTAADWRVGSYSGDPVGSVSAGPAGLHYVGDAPAYASPFVQYADIPVPLPMVATAQAFVNVPPSGPVVKDMNGATIPVRQVSGATVLPVVGDSGVVVDLTTLQRSAQFASEAHWSVWLGAAAPPDAVQRLRDAGVGVATVTTTAQRQDELGREGPALALRLLLVCAMAGAVLSAGAVAISVAVTGRRRSYELAALRAVAVRRSSLVWACVLEQGLLLGIGLLVGVPTGLVVARLALPTLPQTSSPTSLPLTLDVQSLAVSAFVVVTASLMVVTAVVAGVTLVRQAVPDRLREVAP